MTKAVEGGVSCVRSNRIWQTWNKRSVRRIRCKMSHGFLRGRTRPTRRDAATMARRRPGKQTEQNQNRISKIPFGRIRKELCFRFLFDCLFFRSIVGSVASRLRHAYHFCGVYSIVFGRSDTWRTSRRRRRRPTSLNNKICAARSRLCRTAPRQRDSCYHIGSRPLN